MEEIRIGEKSIGEYISAILYAFRNNHETVIVAGLGTRVSKAFNIAELASEALNAEQTDTETFEKDSFQGVRITLKKTEGGK